jgi:hypothetical protein
MGIACRATPGTPGPQNSGTSEPRNAGTPERRNLAARLQPGDAVPDSVLAAARHWQRSGAAGNRILVVSFGSTGCPDQSACAEMQGRLRALQDELQNSPSLKSSIGLLTLSTDPSNDMPAVLRVHADRIGADPELWRFAALPANQVDVVLSQFGASRDNPVTAVVDAEGKLAKIYRTADWTPRDLAQDVQSLVLRAEPAVVSAYIAAQEALASDDYNVAKRALARLTTAVREPAVARLATSAATAASLETMRAAFKPLSEAIVRLPWPAEYQPMYCPMFEGNAGATWVQKAGPVTNPYYGKAMLRCGNDLSVGAHADHSPKFGGVLFMAADAYHHIEATYTRDGLFRVHVYDNFTKPMQVSGFRGRVESAEGGRVLRLVPSADRQTLDVRIGTLTFPAEITLKMVFGAAADEERFDFVFADYSPS